MRKYIILALSIILSVAVSGCSNNDGQNAVENEVQKAKPEEETTVHDYGEAEENQENEHNHGAADEGHGHEGAAENQDGTEEDHHDSQVQIELHHQTIKVNEEAILSVHIQMEEIPLKEAKVRFEIWKKDSNQAHDYVDAAEEGEGAYTAAKTFSESGTYQVKIHVEKEEGHIHDHIELSVEVE